MVRTNTKARVSRKEFQSNLITLSFSFQSNSYKNHNRQVCNGSTADVRAMSHPNDLDTLSQRQQMVWLSFLGESLYSIDQRPRPNQMKKQEMPGWTLWRTSPTYLLMVHRRRKQRRDATSSQCLPMKCFVWNCPVGLRPMVKCTGTELTFRRHRPLPLGGSTQQTIVIV